MATPQYTPSPVSPTPLQPTTKENILPIKRARTDKLTDFPKIAEDRKQEIYEDLKPALENLDKLRKDSTDDPALSKVFHEIVDNIKRPFCAEDGIFNTLKIGGSTCGSGRRKTWKQKHHSQGIGELHHGDLSKRGYSVTKGKTARHRALKKVVRAEGALSTFRKLNAVSTYTKNTSKTKSKTFKRDRNWVKKTFMDK